MRYLDWLATHWRILAPTLAAIGTVGVRLSQPDGGAWFLDNAQWLASAAVALGVWSVHAYRHVLANEPLDDLMDDLPDLNLPEK